MSLLEIARQQMRDGMQIGVDRRNAKLRAKGSARRCYLDERGKMQLRTLTPEELAAEGRDLEISDDEDEEEDTEGA